jgi:type IV pilus assembly protein PilB
MGVAPFLVASSVNCIVAQRLLRRVCAQCREELEPHDELLAELQIDRAAVGDSKLYKAIGCDECHNTGYKGRTGIYEVLHMSSLLRKMILDRNSTRELKDTAMAEGMLSLRKDAVRKMLMGDTTPDEVLRETASD